MNVESITRSLDAIERGINATHTEQRVLSDRISQLEQSRGALPFEGGPVRGQSYGQLAFEALQKNADLFAKTRSVRLELKAAGDPITTTSGRTLISGSVGAPGGRVLGLQYGIPQRPASGTSAVEYSRFTGTQGAAAQQAAEGDAKAAVRPDHTLVVQQSLTVAGMAKMSRQALNDSEQLRRAVDVTLMRSVDTALDAALVNGATGFTGGYEGLATAYTSLVYDALVDAISEGVATMQTAGFAPNVVALNPADWLAISVAKGTANDHYMSGSYLGTMPMESKRPVITILN
jgi:hypothetical protein